MKADVEKMLGRPFSAALKCHDRGATLHLVLSGSCWSDGPLANEKAWLAHVAGRNCGVVVDINACPSIGVYCLQWLWKLDRILHKNGQTLQVQGASKAARALMQTLDVKAEWLGRV